ncbi:MAG: DNA methylase [Acidimicrobiaceae bacterium]|nr:DNA methylase [Acidimicrobiaceae bacterium]MXZ52947.1 DNA methylase [Acidimicrobiaceae bacterium]MYB87934.1 DNA methylase [Acidimicrobiaceae bacterium]MYH94577.1 DNA methylase [Acidimicrobiaceae bacterium]
MVQVSRSDPAYMAHAYLTKVPVAAIVPFIEAFTKPGDVVLDPFAGSGMTGVAALATGRRAVLFDVAVLGRHIGTNYVNLVDAGDLRDHGEKVVRRARERVGDVYNVRCEACGRTAQLAKTVWSVVVECDSCREPVNYYRSLQDAGWRRDRMACPRCGTAASSRGRRLSEEPVADSISCECSRTQLEQAWSAPLNEPCEKGLCWPDTAIAETRQMYAASALGRHGLTSTAAFYSHRNLCALAALRDTIDDVADPALRGKLLFAFTAILTRASKRYQWSRQRPLNASNANYYIAPVFYEWNVFDLFTRKVRAAVRSDDWLRQARGMATVNDHAGGPDVRYEIASAERLPLPDDSVDYVFTDPPFGSNIFYSDMNLFQEAWLGSTTDPAAEAVVDRSDTGGLHRTAERYEAILAGSFKECRRVLRPGGQMTVLFGNSSGAMWQLLQRSIAAAGLEVVPEQIAVLDKGQRSVKGLASGFENVATLDLMLTLRPVSRPPAPVRAPAASAVESAVNSLLSSDSALTPSRLYLALLRHGIANRWDLSRLDLRAITAQLREADFSIDRRSARVVSIPRH